MAILADTRHSISKKNLQSKLRINDHNNFNKLLKQPEIHRYLENEEGIQIAIEDAEVKVKRNDFWVPF